MVTFFIILDALLFVTLLLITAILPTHSQLSSFELQRRAKAGDGEAIKKLRREKLLGTIESLQNIKISGLLVFITIVSIVAFGWTLGIATALVVAFSYELVASLRFVHKGAQKLYDKYESFIFLVIEKHPRFFKLFGTKQHHAVASVHSKEELQHVINQVHFLEPNEKKLLVSGLHFSSLRVGDIMTAKEDIKSIGKNEMLGPLVLDQLHKTGHSCFPVINGDLNRVEGMLDIKDSVSLQDKKSHMAKTLMSTDVHRISESRSIEDALTDFLQQRSHLSIVVNESRETVGILGMKDIITAMLGHAVDKNVEHIEKREEI